MNLQDNSKSKTLHFSRSQSTECSGFVQALRCAPPAARHFVALTNPSALLSLLRYEKMKGVKCKNNTKPKILYPLC
jgi:hypothetical protein